MVHAHAKYIRIQDPSGKIPDDEPVFLLRAQDVHAAHCVRHWAFLNEQANGDLALSRMAREHADKMEAWPVKKLPD